NLAKEAQSLDTTKVDMSFTNAYNLTSADPFSVIDWTKTSTINGKVSTTVYTASTDTFVTTSALSRTSSEEIDSYERPVEVQRGNLTA
ncbi:MAG: hypothetical protein V4736_11825, partial [Bdellovibrionota bacterium]